MSSAGRLLDRPLLADGSLRLAVDPEAEPLVADWLPRLPYGEPEGEAASRIVVVAEPGRGGPEPTGAPTLRLGEAAAWVPGAGGAVRLAGLAGGSSGTVRLEEARAELHAGAGEPERVAWELYSMLTIAAALLLGRLGRTLVHAAATVAPDGAAWLLAGDARSGKTTTCVNLIGRGWDYVSDDQVVLTHGGDAGGELWAEGWPRPFHLDEGWEDGQVTGRRRTVDPRALGPGTWRRVAPLAGTLYPQVTGGASRLVPIPQAEALALLVRQTPWLLADPSTAPGCLELLVAAARRPAFRLELGPDTYRHTEALLACLKPLSSP